MPVEIRSNLEPKEVHETLLETYQKWINFAMGVGKLGGKMLKHPSGRMASSLKAEYNKEGNVVAIYVDSKELGAMENIYIQGHRGFSIKRKMLVAGRPGVHRALDRHGRPTGALYRFIPIRQNPVHPKKAYSLAGIKDILTTKDTPQGGILQINPKIAKMWATNYDRASSLSTKIRTMSNKPGSARWYIPAMPAFNMERLLKDMLPKQIKDRLIIK